MEQATSIDGLFCTPIYRSVIPDSLYGLFTQSEQKFFEDSKEKVNKNAGNVNTRDTYILDNTKLKSLKHKVMSHVESYFEKVYAPSTNVIPYITQSWINYTNENEFHHKHSHANSLVSGVLYLNADIDLDSITFYTTRPSQTIKIDPREDSYNVFNSSQWNYPVKTGDIVLFPSSIDHSVDTKEGKNTRMSLAFNVFVKGTIGSTKGLAELKL
tara:strand:- start:102 stop:740 length:639 start_codon:yes stop_codon:yes gene_type:complete